MKKLLCGLFFVFSSVLGSQNHQQAAVAVSARPKNLELARLKKDIDTCDGNKELSLAFVRQKEALVDRALACDDVDTIQELLAHDLTSIKNSDQYNQTLLMRAAAYDATRVMNFCYESDKTVLNAQSQDGFSALHNAVTKNNAKAVDLLLSWQAMVNACSKWEQMTPFMCACQYGNGPMAVKLAQHGAEQKRKMELSQIGFKLTSGKAEVVEAARKLRELNIKAACAVAQPK